MLPDENSAERFVSVYNGERESSKSKTWRLQKLQQPAHDPERRSKNEKETCRFVLWLRYTICIYKGCVKLHATGQLIRTGNK